MTIRSIPTAVLLDPRNDGVPSRSVVALDHMQSIRKSRVQTLLTTLRPQKLREVETAIHFALGLEA
jgi:mRNA-degrading endonuclease toxin of MazEF toxin-antitoxin module